MKKFLLAYIILELIVIGSSIPPASSSPSLRALAEKKNVLVGAAVLHEFLPTDKMYAETFSREYNLAVPEGEFMMSTIHPTDGIYNFEPADQIVNFAKAHRMKVHGHPLLWNPFTPAWIIKRDVDDVAREHIQTVVRHYRGQVFEWIVVNEAFKSDGTKNWSVWDKTCNKPFTICETSSPTYIENAFRWAREADPTARLVYNDFNAEELNAKSDAIYGMVKDFKARGVPIDAVGFQFHIGLAGLDFVSVKKNLARFVALGVTVEITELDVAVPAHAWFYQVQQAEVYAKAFDTCISTPGCTEITTWGFTDKSSWIPGLTHGQQGRALPFDAEYRPKLAHKIMLKQLGGSND